MRREGLEQQIGRASRLHREGKLKEARKAYRRILKLWPRCSMALHLFGVLEAQQGRLRSACRFLRKSIEIDPESADAYNNLGNTLQKLEDFPQAVQCYKRALELRPVFPEAHNNLGNVAQALNRPDEAVRHYMVALEYRPHYFDALHNLGAVLHARGESEKALSVYQRALAIEPASAVIHYRLGEALQSSDRTTEAIRAFRRAIDLQPDYPEAYYSLGNALKSTGDSAEAIDCYSQTMQLDPDNGSARHMLAALRGETTKYAPTDYVINLFDGYSDKFETHLLEQLHYQVPALLREALERQAPEDRRFRNALDLGCGTGLVGTQVRDIVDRISGVDLAKRMIHAAAKKGVYDLLLRGEMVETLRRRSERYDLFLAADVLIYVGDLRPLFTAVSERALYGTTFAFSIETTVDRDYTLRATGRFAHSQKYIQQMAEQNGFAVRSCENRELRRERGNWARGQIIVLTSPGRPLPK